MSCAELTSTNRSISTVAGTGEKGYSGDGGPATAARLNEPYEIRFDADGNMFFVEMQNNIVRRVDVRTKKISTVAGTGKKGFSGDGGPAIQARLNKPHSIALDQAGGLYICDIGNHRIRRVDLTTGLISTYSGTGERKPTRNRSPITGTPLNGPRTLDFDGHGAFFWRSARETPATASISTKAASITWRAAGKKVTTGTAPMLVSRG